jgi:YVTN family beta-propeller protein
MPADLFGTPDDKLLLVGLTGSHSVEVFDVSGKEPRSVRKIRTGDGAHAFRSAGDGATCTSATAWPTPSARSTCRARGGGTLPAPGGPDCMDVMAGGKLLLVTSRWARKLSVIDTEQKKVVRQVNVGKSPHGVWTLDHAPALSGALLAGLATALRSCYRFHSGLRNGTRAAARKRACEKPVYLTFDTGHMGVAPLVADVLRRQQVRATFFAAHERTQQGDGSLGDHWAPWWKARAAEGHEFASHTWDHVYWRADLGGPPRFRVRPRPGPSAGQDMEWERRAVLRTQIDAAADRLQATSRGRSRCRCSARRAARPRPRCWRPPGLRLCACGLGTRRASWATNCPATNIPTTRCWTRRCATSAAATS